MQQNGEEQARLWAKVVAKAWADDAFKAKLISDPAAVLKAEGLDLRQGVCFKVLEDTPAQAHLVLPAMPPEGNALDEAALDERKAAATCATNLNTSTSY
jgi:hypothetical protein